MTKDDKKMIKQTIDQCAAELYQELVSKYSGKDLERVLYYLQDYTITAFDACNDGIKDTSRRYIKRRKKQIEQDAIANLPENQSSISIIPPFNELAADI